jgi:hypothetical protein
MESFTISYFDWAAPETVSRDSSGKGMGTRQIDTQTHKKVFARCSLRVKSPKSPQNRVAGFLLASRGILVRCL